MNSPITNAQGLPVALAIMGPTAIGKTALAMALVDELQSRLPVRLISVDSAMVFKHMDIGTAKPSPAELRRYPHALVDLLEPTEAYSAAAFLQDARDQVVAAWESGELPVFVGGTMMYFRALRDGLATMPPRDGAVREELQRVVDARGLDALFDELRRADPVAAAKLEPQNRQRIIRALEVFRLTGKPISAFWKEPQTGLIAGLGGELLEHALVPVDRQELHERINQRFSAMLEAGFVGEMQALVSRGDLHPDLPAMRCVGYRQMWEHVAGSASLADAVRAGQAATRQLAKRQLTWLRGWQQQGLVTLWPTAADPREHLPALLDQVAI